MFLTEKLISVTNSRELDLSKEALSLYSGKADLLSWINGTHETETLEDVRNIFKAAETKIKDQGLILIGDLVRPNTKAISMDYVKVMCEKIDEKEKPFFLADFQESIFAAWTQQELISAIPKNTGRNWYHLTLRGFPIYQFLVSLPGKNQNLFLRKGIEKKKIQTKLPPSLKGDWVFLKLLAKAYKVKKL